MQITPGICMTMGDKPAYSVGPHSVRPLRRLAGGSAPSDPGVSGPPRERRPGRCSTSRNPSRGRRAERSPLARRPCRRDPRRPAGSLALTGAGLRIRPWMGLWPTGGRHPSPVPPEARKTALTAILGVLGAVRRNPRPWDRMWTPLSGQARIQNRVGGSWPSTVVCPAS